MLSLSHSVRRVGSAAGRLWRRTLIGILVVGAGATAGHRSGTVARTPVVFAACGSANNVICEGSKSSLLEVNHQTDIEEFVGPVEPNTGETFTAQVFYATSSGGACSCTETSYTATIRVDWDQANNEWDVACTSGCNQYSGPIFGVTVCDDERCLETAGKWHSWLYVLELEVDESVSLCSPGRPAYLNRVVWTTTSVDDGHMLSSMSLGCYEYLAVQPTSQTFAVTDTGANQNQGTFVCFPSDCQGPTPITLTYD